MRCYICDAITENCSFDETNAMVVLCNPCKEAVNETIGENQQDDEVLEEVEEFDWLKL